MNWNDGEGSNVDAELRKRLERCEETLRKSQRIEKEGIQAIASAAAAEKRLEKCEAALKMCADHLQELYESHDGTASDLVALDAARAALEG